MKKIQTDIHYNPEVQDMLMHYNQRIHKAMEAVQKLESIAISARLSKLFGVPERKMANALQQDYLLHK